MAEEPKSGKAEVRPLGERLKSAAADGLRGTRRIHQDLGKVTESVARHGVTAALDAIGSVQRRLGEDYYAILERNPVVVNSFARGDALMKDRDLLGTAFNLPWMTTLLWMSAAGMTLVRHRQVDHVLGRLFHYGPGHIAHWSEVNAFMDSVSGSGHRLKFGHSVDFLPQIVEQFGPEGVPAFLSHLLQDSFTTDGIPILPNAWSIKQGLAAAGLAPKTASGLVALTASEAVAFVGIGMAIAKLVVSVERERRRRGYMNAAADALESNDFSAAAENYKRAIEIKASPAAFIALGQVYVRRTATRPYAFQMFKKAMDELASESDNTFQFGGATISLRGVAGLQALSTADTLGDRYPQFFDEEVTNLVNGTVASFRRVAEQQEAAYANWIPNSIVTPPLLSAATNRFLAAQAACQYPLLDERGALVTRNTEAALRNLGLAAQYDEDGLRTRMSQLRQIWAAAVLPPDEAEIALASA